MADRVASKVYLPLVTGIAGIGHWLLRVHAGGRLPTVLVPAQHWKDKQP